jgi:hypothetical protein
MRYRGWDARTWCWGVVLTSASVFIASLTEIAFAIDRNFCGGRSIVLTSIALKKRFVCSASDGSSQSTGLMAVLCPASSECASCIIAEVSLTMTLELPRRQTLPFHLRDMRVCSFDLRSIFMINGPSATIGSRISFPDRMTTCEGAAESVDGHSCYRRWPDIAKLLSALLPGIAHSIDSGSARRR